MTPSALFILTLHLPLLTAAITGSLQPHVRINDRLARVVRDEVFIDTPSKRQNLCGDSTFHAVDHDGPSRHDCAYLVNSVGRNDDGFWMAGNFGSDGMSWAEITRLRNCGIKVRRTDGERSDVPFGNEDVIDLVNSVLAEFSGEDHLPTVQGQMTCSRDGSSAAVEWQIFSPP